MTALFPRPDLTPMARFGLEYRCRCSRQKVVETVGGLGKGELHDILTTQGKAEVTCEFCGTLYEIGPDELKAMLHTPEA
jgi:molecular chaperone Hsp33